MGEAAVPRATSTRRSSGAAHALRDRVTADLARRILSGAYPEGAAIPVEADLVAEFGVSRTVLREAVRTLAAKGLLETRQRAGTLVPAKTSWHLLDPDVLAWMGRIDPDREFTFGLVEARAVIEPAAAALAAERSTGRDLAAMEAAFEAMCAATPGDVEASIRADLAFHLAILRASRNPVFANLGDVVGAALLSVFRLTTTASDNYAATLAVHERVLDAIRLRDSPRARAEMEGLLAVASRDLLRTLREPRRDGG
jgi:DNA-binding FadR family transcriptional regulator